MDIVSRISSLKKVIQEMTFFIACILAKFIDPEGKIARGLLHDLKVNTDEIMTLQGHILPITSGHIWKLSLLDISEFPCDKFLQRQLCFYHKTPLV